MSTLALFILALSLTLAVVVIGVTRTALQRTQHDAATLRGTNKALDQHCKTAELRRAEIEATLQSMTEGVVVVKPDGRIRELNPAALKTLRLDAATSIGIPFPQAVRNAALQRLVDIALGHLPAPEATSTSQALQADVTLRSPTGDPHDDRQLRAEAAALRDATGQRHGAVLMLHDLTRLRQLESVRQDFVANVSHELRTPVSAIKAATEALRSQPPPTDDQRTRFTDIVARQADRLEAIINDLLTLTQLDTAVTGDATSAPSCIAPVVAAAVETCGANARNKHITLHVDVPANLHARIASAQLEQALINLIDNAVKYSPETTRVDINAHHESQNQLVLSITDHGRGIEAQHLPRLFERFYRTDRARSRQLGGTGLGLSIVKHILEQAGGHVSVESTLGQGSTFRLHLQAALPPVAFSAATPNVS